jgi:hypothetical protein
MSFLTKPPVRFVKPRRDMQSLARMRRQAKAIEDNGIKTAATQLLRFNVCPCVTLRVYDKCCGPLHGDLSK